MKLVRNIVIGLVGLVITVMIGAAAINVLSPNMYKSIVNALEQQVFNATSISFDWNGDGVAGQAGGGTDFSGGNNRVADDAAAGAAAAGGLVEGFN